MSEKQQTPLGSEAIKNVPNMADLANQILTSRPDYVLVNDAHITSEPQRAALALIEHLTKDPSYKAGTVGFYVEALNSDSDVAKDKLSGGVLNYDANGKTKYGEVIQKAQKLGVNVHGIDIPGYDSESDERMLHWEKTIKDGREPIKVLLVGAGHIWNNSSNTADLVTRLGKTQWVFSTTVSYSPPGYKDAQEINTSQALETERKYKITKYILS